jgi:arylformamidase
MFDLEPVSLSSRREYVRFDNQIVEELSPQRHLVKLTSPIVVFYGSLESPEFQRQGRDFVTAADRAGKDVRLIVADNYNHFDILETLANPFGILGISALRQMNLV